MVGMLWAPYNVSGGELGATRSMGREISGGALIVHSDVARRKTRDGVWASGAKRLGPRRNWATNARERRGKPGP